MRFAKAIAKTLVSLVASFRDSQSVPGWRLLRRTMICAMAPRYSRRRMYRLPIFEIPPLRGFPPVECCFGVRPSQAA